ncbi:DUF6182 family protein [Streptomyces canus]|uniref:DUF6182 family protein n=1 Tax=Streptomyces canus TaxID=58343 RepID=UPI0030E0040C
MTSTEHPTTVGSPAKERLAELLAERAAWVGGPPRDPAAGHPAEATVVVLLRSFDLDGLVNGARAFAAGLAPAEADAWRRSWTRTLFLFGNPANLTERTPPRLVSPTGTTAWLGPYAPQHLPGPIRLYKPVSGVLPELRPDIEIAPAETPAGSPPTPGGPCRPMHIAVRDVKLADYLIHLHHALSESVLQGRLRLDERLRLIHSPDLGAEAVGGTSGYARVHHAPDDPERLRCHVWLSDMSHHGRHSPTNHR